MKSTRMESNKLSLPHRIYFNLFHIDTYSMNTKSALRVKTHTGILRTPFGHDQEWQSCQNPHYIEESDPFLNKQEGGI